MPHNRYRHEAETTTKHHAKKTNAAFTEGSILNHIWVMTYTSSIGILALFAVDLVDMYFLSLLGETQLASAVGYAGTVLFFAVAISIGMMITMVALVSKAIGEDDEELAKREMNSVFVFTATLITIFCAVLFIFAEPILAALGATGATLEYAKTYMRIVLVFTPFMAIGMSGNGVLRAMGDAKRSMYTTLIAGIVNAVLDPILIFGVGWGLEGAAYASGISRLTIMGLALFYLIKVHDFWEFDLHWQHIKGTVKPVFTIAIPAVFTNMAGPIGGAFMVGMLSQFGTDTVAGFAVLGRVVPVAFVMIYSLSGAIGPIVGQNHGAKQLGRIQQTWQDALLFVLVYVVVMAALLFVLRDHIPQWFSITGQGAELIRFYFGFLAIGFLFHGITFSGNAMFNNLGYPQYAMLCNMLKSTVFLIPLAYLGSFHGFKGVLVGEIIALTLASLVTYILVRKVMRNLVTQAAT